MIDTTKKCSISVAETKNIHYLIKRLHSTPTFQQTFWSKSEEKKSQGTWGSWDSSWLQICIQDDLEQTTHQAARHVTPRVNVEHALLDSIPSRNTNLCRPLQELFFLLLQPWRLSSGCCLVWFFTIDCESCGQNPPNFWALDIYRLSRFKLVEKKIGLRQCCFKKQVPTSSDFAPTKPGPTA